MPTHSTRMTARSTGNETARTHPWLALTCTNCSRGITLEYAAGPQLVKTVFFCPACYKANRLDVPGQIRGVRRVIDHDIR